MPQHANWSGRTRPARPARRTEVIDLAKIESDLRAAFADEAECKPRSDMGWTADHFKLQTEITNGRLEVYQRGFLPDEGNYLTVWENGNYEMHWSMPRNFRVTQVLVNNGLSAPEAR